jgi:hypothetical protein
MKLYWNAQLFVVQGSGFGASFRPKLLQEIQAVTDCMCVCVCVCVIWVVIRAISFSLFGIQKLSFATLTPQASMTHPQNCFHSWAVNGVSDLPPFSLQLWATVSAILFTLTRTWQLIRCSLKMRVQTLVPHLTSQHLLFPLRRYIILSDNSHSCYNQTASHEAGSSELATIPICRE